MSHRHASPPKSTLLAYVLWLLLGGFGIHRFYLRRFGSGALMLILTVVGYATTGVLIGFAMLIAVGLWWLLDALLIPGLVRQANGTPFPQNGGVSDPPNTGSNRF